jgi:hypothetical protein
MDRFEYDHPTLHPQENEVLKHRSVKIYDGDEKVLCMILIQYFAKHKF